jgi:hypothetical protein
MRYTRRSNRKTKRSIKAKRITRRLHKKARGGQRNWLGTQQNNNSNSNSSNSNSSNSNSSNNNSNNNNANANNNSRPRISYWNRVTIDDKLRNAIIGNDYDGLKKLLDESDIDLNNTPDYIGMSPLIHAVNASSLPIVELLVEYGADINKKVFGFTALSHAKRRADIQGDSSIFDYLMEKCGTDCTYRELPVNIYENTPNNQYNNNQYNNNEWANGNNANNVNNANNKNNNNKNNNNNANEPRNVNNSLELGQCFDPAMANNSANTKEFLKESKQNIVLVLKEKAICLNRVNIKKFTKMFYECKSDKGTIGDDNVIMDVKYGKLMPYNQILSEDELKKFQNKEHIIFKLKEDRRGKAFVSTDVRNRRGSYVSADHCQEGSGGTIYTVEGYTMEDGLDFLRKNNKN